VRGATYATKLLGGYAVGKLVKWFADKREMVTNPGKEAAELVEKIAAAVAADSEAPLRASMDSAEDADAEQLFQSLNAAAVQSDIDETAQQGAEELLNVQGPQRYSDYSKAFASYFKSQSLSTKLTNFIEEQFERKTPAKLRTRQAFSGAKFGVKSIGAGSDDFTLKSPLSNASLGDTGVLGWLQGAFGDIGLGNGEQISTTTTDLGSSMSMTSSFSYDYTTPTRADYVRPLAHTAHRLPQHPALLPADVRCCCVAVSVLSTG
jgi:hypothetical protein